MVIDQPTFFIGYDSKEDIAYRVCKQSLLKQTSIPIKVLSLKLYELIAKKFYNRTIDPLASTEFTYSRFLVPSLMSYKGWAVFCDCDFIFLDDVAKLFEGLNQEKAVYCVKHDYTPKKNTRWMDNNKPFIQKKIGLVSLFLIVPTLVIENLDVKTVNSESGSYLHQFKWLK